MRIRPNVLLPVACCAVTVAACGAGPPSPSGLAYSLPEPVAVTYETGDTSVWSVAAGGQSMGLSIASSATLETSFERWGDRVRVTVAPRDFSGDMTQPMGAPIRVGRGDLEGTLAFTLDRRGNPEIVGEPDVRGAAARFFGSLHTAHSLFPRLPGTAVDVGGTWTDTIRFEGAQGPGEVSSTSVATYTVSGDTVVAGRSVVRIEVTGTRERTEEADLEGVSLGVDVSGEISGWVLWDARRAIMVESYMEEDLTGTMSVSMAPFPLGLRIRGHTRTSLRN